MLPSSRQSGQRHRLGDPAGAAMLRLSEGCVIAASIYAATGRAASCSKAPFASEAIWLPGGPQ